MPEFTSQELRALTQSTRQSVGRSMTFHPAAVSATLPPAPGKHPGWMERRSPLATTPWVTTSRHGTSSLRTRQTDHHRKTFILQHAASCWTFCAAITALSNALRGTDKAVLCSSQSCVKWLPTGVAGPGLPISLSLISWSVRSTRHAGVRQTVD